jgi:hypothetical protein
MATITIPVITSVLTTSFTNYITTTINKSATGPAPTIIKTTTEVTTNTQGVSTVQNIEDVFITVLVTVLLSLIGICIQQRRVAKFRRRYINQSKLQLLPPLPPSYSNPILNA